MEFQAVEVFELVKVGSPMVGHRKDLQSRRTEIRYVLPGLTSILTLSLGFTIPQLCKYYAKRISERQVLSLGTMASVRVRHPLSWWLGGSFYPPIVHQGAFGNQVPLLLLLAAAGSAFVGWQARSLHTSTLNMETHRSPIERRLMQQKCCGVV